MLKNRREKYISVQIKASYRVSIILLFGFFIFSLSIDAQEVKVINEFNNEVVLPDSIKINSGFSLEHNRQRVSSWLLEEGFLSSEVIVPNDSTFLIKRGCHYSMVLYLLEGAEPFRIDYNQKVLQDLIHQELVELSNQGYANAKAFIMKFEPSQQRCEVVVEVGIETGEVIFANGIVFSGNRQNSKEYLQKISGYYDSLLVTPKNLNELTDALEYSELFDDVQAAEYIMIDDRPSILIQLQERSMNSFDGLLGYVPDAQGNGQIVGDMELSLWNALSQGNGIELMYKRLRPETSRLELGVSQNWIGMMPLSIDAGFQFYQNDSTYQSRSLRLNGEYNFKNGMKLTGGLNRTTTSTSQVSDLEPGGSLIMAELGFLYSSLKGRTVPKKGLLLEAGFGTGSKVLEIDSLKAFPVQTMFATGRWYLPVFKQSIIALRANSRVFISGNYSDADLYRLGGAKTFRGYSEEQFRASRIFWGDIEYRFHTDDSSYLFLFGAIGGYHRPVLVSETNNQFKTTEYLNSFGLGLSYKIRVGRLTFTYALSPQETIGNGKVHVGIMTRL